MINENLIINESKWDTRSAKYDDKRYHFFRYLQKKTIDHMDLSEDTNILDLGCGTGWAIRQIASRLNQNGNFWGADISSGMIEKAKINSSGINNISFTKSNAEELPFSDNYFDKIICTNSFHHYPDPVKAVLEVFRVLKSGGTIYILDVTADDFLIRWINRMVQENEKAHVSFYSSIEYRRLFTESGLTYIKSGWLIYPFKIHIAKK
jgi:ubiquinone/menaquinone biosynthesis C-methylase UbiE